MSLAGTERRRQLVTAGIGTALTLVMGAVLIMGFRLATHMRADIARAADREHAADLPGGDLAPAELAA